MPRPSAAQDYRARVSSVSSFAPTTSPRSSFTPNAEQQAIFDAIKSGAGHVFVSAGAGSGKTTTLVEASKLIDRSSAIFVAFNKVIVEELSTRLPAGMECKTMHSAGRGAVWAAAGKPAHREWTDDTKYKQLARIWLSTIGVTAQNTNNYGDLVDQMAALSRFARLSLVNTSDLLELQVAALIQKYDLDALADVERAARGLSQMLSWGCSMDGAPPAAIAQCANATGRTYGVKDCIDFVDMIYLPVALGLPVKRYKTVFVDEAQDLSPCQQELCMRMLAPEGRIVMVGDPRQAIYSFAGADCNSVETLVKRTAATILPLMVCYRCPSSHIAIANRIVPELKAKPGAPTGIVRQVQYGLVHRQIGSGDMVLCRTTAPLVSMCFDLIEQDVPAVVRGRDIGQQLTRLVQTVAKQRGFEWSKFLSSLHSYETNQVSLLSRRENSEMQVQSLQDRVRCVEVIYGRKLAAGTIYDVDSLCSAIESFFSDNGRGGVVLSTIHKAKGLEADNIYLLRFDLLPHPMAKSDEAQQQEAHLEYIALTRAKATLTFIVGDGTEKGEGKGAADASWLTEKPVEAPAQAIVDPDPFGAEVGEDEEEMRHHPDFDRLITAAKQMARAGDVPFDFPEVIAERYQCASVAELQLGLRFLENLMKASGTRHHPSGMFSIPLG